MQLFVGCNVYWLWWANPQWWPAGKNSTKHCVWIHQVYILGLLYLGVWRVLGYLNGFSSLGGTIYSLFNVTVLFQNWLMHQFRITYVLFLVTIFIYLILYFFIYDLQMQRKVILYIHIIWSNIPSYIYTSHYALFHPFLCCVVIIYICTEWHGYHLQQQGKRSDECYFYWW